jgi:LmbE family N-acetylglucosaminyl deacetylase
VSVANQRSGLASYLSQSKDETYPDGIIAPETALAIGAHPDDIEFGSGGTLAKWANSGSKCYFAILTDGRLGTWDPGIDPFELAAARRKEARAAAQSLGAEPPYFFEQVDGSLEASGELVLRLVSLVRRIRPNVILTHDPFTRYRLHPDHQAAGEAVIRAIVKSREPTVMPELGEYFRPDLLLLFESENPNHAEPLKQPDLETKAQALACHKTQARSSFGVSEIAELQDRVLDAVARTALETGNSMGLAFPCEAFRLLADL